MTPSLNTYVDTRTSGAWQVSVHPRRTERIIVISIAAVFDPIETGIKIVKPRIWNKSALALAVMLVNEDRPVHSFNLQ